jgi:hypothetical protein
VFSGAKDCPLTQVVGRNSLLNTGSELDLSAQLSEKVNQFPEYRMGSNKVSLRLRDGRRVPDVFLAWGRTIVKIGECEIRNVSDLSFCVSEIIDVESEI